MEIKEILDKSLEFGFINEERLLKIIHFANGKTFCIASVFKSKNLLSTNRHLNKKLFNTLKYNEIQPYKLIGYWKKSQDGVEYTADRPKELVNALEESFYSSNLKNAN
ncbi:MAG: hypothetical protein R2771_11655 [Saprospiraceae bacterium]